MPQTTPPPLPSLHEVIAIASKAYESQVGRGRTGGAAVTPAYDEAVATMRAKWPNATGRTASRACDAALNQIYRLAGF